MFLNSLQWVSLCEDLCQCAMFCGHTYQLTALLSSLVTTGKTTVNLFDGRSKLSSYVERHTSLQCERRGRMSSDVVWRTLCSKWQTNLFPFVSRLQAVPISLILLCNVKHVSKTLFSFILTYICLLFCDFRFDDVPTPYKHQNNQTPKPTEYVFVTIKQWFSFLLFFKCVIKSYQLFFLV